MTVVNDFGADGFFEVDSSKPTLSIIRDGGRIYPWKWTARNHDRCRSLPLGRLLRCRKSVGFTATTSVGPPEDDGQDRLLAMMRAG
jgi:hypothetical protein